MTPLSPSNFPLCKWNDDLDNFLFLSELWEGKMRGGEREKEREREEECVCVLNFQCVAARFQSNK